MTTRRTAKKAAMQSQAKYDAAGMGRRIRSWSPPSSGPNRAIEGLQKIRDRSRDSSRNDWAGASSVQKWTTNLVGVGIVPRWKNEKFTKLWKKHVPNADADCVLDVYGMQTLGVRSWFDSGEVFMRRRPRNAVEGVAVPVQYQLIEADYVPLLDADVWPGMPVGNTIRQGIERNKYGKRTAYWVYREHPGDKPGRPGTNDLVRVAASDMRHMFEPKRPGQLRGVSGLAEILVRLRSSADFEDAVLDRQKLANLFVAFITRQMPDAADIDYDPATGLPKFYDANGNPMAGLEPGTTQELRPGESVTFANPPEAGTTYSEYMRSTHLGTAAGTGLPYEVMSGDIANVSDRSLRVMINEFRRFARQRQWQIVIPMLCQPMVDWWADAAALDGSLSLSELEDAKTPTWSPEGWEYIHPVQDAQGKIALIDAGIVSRSGVISERGDDPAEVDAERKEEKERADKLGLTPPPPAPGMPGGPPAPAPKPTPKQQRMEALTEQHMVASIAALNRAPVAAAGPVVNVHNSMTPPVNNFVANVEPTPVNVNNHVDVQPPVNNIDVQPPVNNITNHVEVEPTTVNVAAPTVNVTNDVQPATVDVSVSLPDRKTTTDITRDRDGNIVDVVQIEKTLQ